MSENRVLVTGATGFTGGALARKLVEQDKQVTAIVRANSNTKPLKDLGVKLIEGDIRDAQVVDQAAKGVDLIFNLAATYRTAGHSDEFYEAVNIGGVQNIIDAARNNNVGRTVHCSTIGVHGDIKEIPSSETSPFNPGDIYQRSKLAGEELFREAMKEGLSGAIVRPGAIYGPGDTRLLKIFKLVNRGIFPLFGGGKNFYHLSYIDDLVDGFILCGSHPNAAGETFILCSDEYQTLQALTSTIANELAVRKPWFKPPITPILLLAKLCENICRPFGIEPPLHTRRVEFFIKSRAFSNAKARSTIGFEPKVSTQDGVRRTIEWYQQNGFL